MTRAAAFCKTCGDALVSGNAFCVRCGTPVGGTAQAVPTAIGRATVPSPTPVAQPTDAVSTLGTAYEAVTAAGERARTLGGAFGAVGALPGGLVALPWQTIAGRQAPDIRALVAAGAPVAQSAVRASLRRPAVALCITTLLDTVVAVVSGQPAALKMVAVRAVMGLGTSLLGMIVGSKAGPLRTVTGAASGVTGLVQTVSALVTAVAAATTPASLLALVPSMVSQLSSLVMLVKTTVLSLRR